MLQSVHQGGGGGGGGGVGGLAHLAKGVQHAGVFGHKAHKDRCQAGALQVQQTLGEGSSRYLQGTAAAAAAAAGSTLENNCRLMGAICS